MRLLSQTGGPYPFGVDPVWHGSRTELPFLNSVKMKMSIVLGVTQMNLGILMSLFNQRYFRDNLSTMCASRQPSSLPHLLRRLTPETWRPVTAALSCRKA